SAPRPVATADRDLGRWQRRQGLCLHRRRGRGVRAGGGVFRRQERVQHWLWRGHPTERVNQNYRGGVGKAGRAPLSAGAPLRRSGQYFKQRAGQRRIAMDTARVAARRNCTDSEVASQGTVQALNLKAAAREKLLRVQIVNRQTKSSR